MSFSDAMNELKVDVLNGKSIDEVVASIAADFSVHPNLLRTKFVESYRSEEALRETAKATSKETVISAHIARSIEEACWFYGVPQSAVKLAKVNGELCSIVCYDPNASTWRYRGVRHEDGSRRKWGKDCKIEMVS